MAIDQRVKAAKIWPVLVEAARAKSKITFAHLGPKVSITQRNLSPPLEVIAQQCKRNGWPPLTVIVQTDGKPGASFTEGDDVEGAAARVFEYDWTKVKNPFALFTSTV